MARIDLAWDRDLERLSDGANRYLMRVTHIGHDDTWQANRAVYLVCLNVARKFRRLGVDGVWRAIEAWNARSQRPWPEDLLRRKVRDACQWVASHPDTQ